MSYSPFGYECDDGEVRYVVLRTSSVGGWNPALPVPPGSFRCFTWRNRKRYGVKPRVAILRRFEPVEGRFITTLAPVFQKSTFDGITVASFVDWGGFNWQIVGTVVELLL